MTITSNYIVTGMTCGHCVNHVTQEVMAIPGVTDVKLVVAGDMTVLSEAELAFDAVKAAVEEAGDYAVTVVDTDVHDLAQ